MPLEFYKALGGQVAFEAQKAYREAKDQADLDKQIWRKREAARKKAEEERRAEGAARFKAKVETQHAPAPAPDPMPEAPTSGRSPSPSPELVEAIMLEMGLPPSDWPRAAEEARRRERELARTRAPERAIDTS